MEYGDRTLTPSEILTMPAGEEMDALVAEKVMGWTDAGSAFCRECLNPEVLHWHDAGGRLRCGYNSFSRGISAAWEVVEKMGKFKVESCPEGCEESEIPHVYAEGPTQIGHNAVTAPLAICRAALLAVVGADE